MVTICKISARREKMQVYLQFSEPQPNFKLRSRLILVQGERKCKFQRVNVKKALAFSLLNEAS